MTTYTCPHCSEQIDHLVILCHATVAYTYTPGKRGGTEFGPNTIDDIGDVYLSECPVCHEELEEQDMLPFKDDES